MGVNTLPSNTGGCGMSGGGCGDSGYNPGNSGNAVAKPAPIIFDDTQSGGGDQVQVVFKEKYFPPRKIFAVYQKYFVQDYDSGYNPGTGGDGDSGFNPGDESGNGGNSGFNPGE